jgi:hypothetical protein
VLTEEEFAELTRLAEERHKPISVLIREAVATLYLEKTALDRRRSALKQLLSLNAPVAEWPEMEQEIVRGATES